MFQLSVASPGKRVELTKRWSVHGTHVRNMRKRPVSERGPFEVDMCWLTPRQKTRTTCALNC